MNENDAFYNALIDVAAWDKENTLDRFMNSDSLFKKFLYKFITTDGSYVKLRSSLVERDLENAKLYSHTLKGIAANLGLVNLFDVSNNILSLLREGNLEEALRILLQTHPMGFNHPFDLAVIQIPVDNHRLIEIEV